MAVAKAWLGIGAVLAAGAVVAACSSSGSPSAHGGSADVHAALQQVLPPGFSAPGVVLGSPTGTAAVLATSPSSVTSPSALHPIALPSSQKTTVIVASVLAVPAAVDVEPLLSSTAHFAPGASFTAAAGKLPAGSAHAALFVLEGPGTYADHLVAVSNGVSQAVVTLPQQLAPGTYYLAIEDLSALHSSGGRLSGRATVALGVLSVR